MCLARIRSFFLFFRHTFCLFLTLSSFVLDPLSTKNSTNRFKSFRTVSRIFSPQYMIEQAQEIFHHCHHPILPSPPLFLVILRSDTVYMYYAIIGMFEFEVLSFYQSSEKTCDVDDDNDDFFPFSRFLFTFTFFVWNLSSCGLPTCLVQHNIWMQFKSEWNRSMWFVDSWRNIPLTWPWLRRQEVSSLLSFSLWYFSSSPFLLISW